MLGTWIAKIQEALRADFPASKNYGPGDFATDKMPPPVAHFLEYALARRTATVEGAIDADWFDTQAPAVRDAVHQLQTALSATVRYPAIVWEPSLDRSVELVASYLVQPAEGLLRMLYGDGGTEIKAIGVAQRLGYFQPYRTLLEVIREYASRRAHEAISREDFRAAVLRADRSLAAANSPTDWLEQLQPLFEMASTLCVAGESPNIPTPVLKLLFEAKGCDDIVRRIEAIETIGGRRAMDEGALLKTLRPAEPEPKPAPEHTPQAASPAITSLGFKGEPRMPASPKQRNDMHTAASQDQQVPRWMQFASASQNQAQAPVLAVAETGTLVQATPVRGGAMNVAPESVAPEPTVAEPTAPEPAVAESQQPDQFVDGIVGVARPVEIGQRAPLPDDNHSTTGDGSNTAVPRWQHFDEREKIQELGSSTNNSPGKVRGLEQRVLGDISAEQCAWFVNELVAGDHDVWENILRQLEAAPSWAEATLIISAEIFEKRPIDIYSQSVVDFTNAVESRFS